MLGLCARAGQGLIGVGVAVLSQRVMCAPGDQKDRVSFNPRDRAAAIEAEHGVVKDRRNLWRDDPYNLDPDTMVVAVFGITGGGKSSTCNTMLGSRERPFEQSTSIMSVTKAVSYRDYMYFRRPCRIIDTPGFSDTHRSQQEVAEEVERFKAYAPHGLSAILFIVPHGRFTPEQEAALNDLRALLGPTCTKHAMVIFTHCLSQNNRQQLLRRDELLDEVNQLPADSTLRKLVEECSHRVVPVENVLEPAKTESRNRIHQRILDTLAENQHQNYDASHFFTHAAAAAKPPTHKPPSPATTQLQPHQHSPAPLSPPHLSKPGSSSPPSPLLLEEVPASCVVQLFRDVATGRRTWTLRCTEL